VRPYQYSYIEAAVVQIGDDTLEVTSFGEYALNGIGNADLSSLAGYPIRRTSPNEKQHVFEIVIDSDTKESIFLSAFKDLVAVKIHNGSLEHFGSSQGLIGTFDGKLVGRDGTDMTASVQLNPNAGGQEWQVHSEKESTLFRTVRSPQHPAQQCKLPSATETKSRRLGETIAHQAAAKACSMYHEEGPAKEACIFDVMAIGDLDMAQAGAF